MRNSFDDAYNGRTVYVLHRLQGSHNVVLAIKNDRIGSRDTKAAETRVRSIPFVRRIQIIGLRINAGVLDSERVAEYVVELSEAAAEIEYLQGPIDRGDRFYGVNHVSVSLRVQPGYQSVEGLISLI